MKRPEDFKVLQVKEKFGGLRFYVSGYNDEVNEAIRECEAICAKTCEICGSTKDDVQSRTGGWILTLCNNCEQRRKTEPKSAWVNPPEED